MYLNTIDSRIPVILDAYSTGRIYSISVYFCLLIHFRLNMIYSELRNYLVQVSSEELVDLFDRGISILEAFSVPDYLDTFDITLGDYLSSTEQESVDAVTHILITYLDKLLQEHGIFTNDQATIGFKIDLLNGIYLLQSYEDWKSIDVIIESQSTPIETFAELMMLVINHPVEAILPYILDVEDSVIDNIKVQLVDNHLSKIIPVEDIADQVNNYRKYKTRYRNEPIWSDKFFVNSESIGLPYHTYLCVYLQEFNERLTPGLPNSLKAQDVAKDLFGLMCLSLEGVAKSKEVIRKYSDLIYHDLKQLSELDYCVNTIILEYNKNAKNLHQENLLDCYCHQYFLNFVFIFG